MIPPKPLLWILGNPNRNRKNERIEMWLDRLMALCNEEGKPTFVFTFEAMQEINRQIFPNPPVYIV